MTTSTSFPPEQHHPEPTCNWRAFLPVHPACDAYPGVPREELITIGNDILKRGLQSEIVVWRKKSPREERYHDEFQLLDGRTRLDAMAAIGLKFKFELGNRRNGPFLHFLSSDRCGFDGSHVKIKVEEIPEEEIEAYVASANLYRRHLTAGEKNIRLVAALKATPELSNAQIGKQTGRDDKTVAKVRAALESTSEIPRLEKTRGKDGKARQAKVRNRPVIPVPSVPAEPAIDAEPEARSGKDAAGLSSAIAHDWDEVERAFETLTAHTVAQVAQAIPPGKAALITEIADYFTALAAKLTARPVGNGEAPVVGSDHPIPGDLSIPRFLKRPPLESAS